MSVIDVDEVFEEEEGGIVKRDPYHSLRHQAHIVLKQEFNVRVAMLRAPYHPISNPIGFHPLPSSWTSDKRCDGCKLGDHHHCHIVYCYGCDDPYHGRKPGGLGVNGASAHDTLIKNYMSHKTKTFGQESNPLADYERRASI